jgi:DHA3 family macrolide efflux protein-like MFS transporter
MSFLFGGVNIGLGLSPNIWVFFGFMLLCGLITPAMNTPITTLFQVKAEPEFLGRVFGLVGVVMSLAMPLGMAVLGPLADTVASETLMIVTGLATFVVLAIAVLLPSGRQSLREGVTGGENKG